MSPLGHSQPTTYLYLAIIRMSGVPADRLFDAGGDLVQERRLWRHRPRMELGSAYRCFLWDSAFHTSSTAINSAMGSRGLIDAGAVNEQHAFGLEPERLVIRGNHDEPGHPDASTRSGRATIAKQSAIFDDVCVRFLKLLAGTIKRYATRAPRSHAFSSSWDLVRSPCAAVATLRSPAKRLSPTDHPSLPLPTAAVHQALPASVSHCRTGSHERTWQRRRTSLHGCSCRVSFYRRQNMLPSSVDVTASSAKPQRTPPLP